MQILLIQSASEHPENWHYREAQCFLRAFDRLHVQAVAWGPGYQKFSRPIDSLAAKSDAVLVLENYDSGWLPDLSKIDKPKFLWVIDSHKIAGELRAYASRNGISHTLVAWKNHLGQFKNPVWFPPCFPADLCRPTPYAPKSYDVGFCGSRGNRGDWLDRLSRDVGLRQDIFVLGDGMVGAINSYKIHFNKNETPDVLAFRTFETLGCGTFLMTDEAGNVAELFRCGQHLVTYRDYDDCVDKTRFYLKHPEERERIARNGREEALLKHTFDFRALEILSMLNPPSGPLVGGKEVRS